MAKQNSQALWGIFLFLTVSCKDSGTASSENKNRVTPASLEQTQSNTQSLMQFARASLLITRLYSHYSFLENVFVKRKFKRTANIKPSQALKLLIGKVIVCFLHICYEEVSLVSTFMIYQVPIKYGPKVSEPSCC